MVGGVIRSAILDSERVYRYRLTRTWERSRPPITWIMLNPSTADERVDDPTISRVIGFSRAWGYGSALVVNLFAFRAASRGDLRRSGDPVGPSNDAHVTRTLARTGTAVAAWGNHGRMHNPATGMPRSDEMWALLEKLDNEVLCLGFTAQGQPTHPLYLAGDTKPTPADTLTASRVSRLAPTSS